MLSTVYYLAMIISMIGIVRYTYDIVPDMLFILSKLLGEGFDEDREI